MSTLKTNTIDTSTGTTITIPTGRVLTVTDNSGISIACTAVSATAAQLNVMASVTSSAAELNVLDGIPAGLTSTELGYSDGVTSAIQTQINTKGVGDASLDVAQNWTKGQRGEITALTDGATITIDMADSNNFSVTLEGNRTFANPSNDTAGQCGSIFITQDGTGSRTANWNSDWDFAGGTAPTLTTTAAAVDRVDYVILDSSNIHAVATLAYS